MKKHYITYFSFFIVLLTESCGGLGSYGWNFECRATNVTTLFKEGVSVDTFKFFDLQRETRANKRSIKEKIYMEEALYFSKDSVLNFFHTEWEYITIHNYWDVDIRDHHLGLIDENYSDNPAGTLFITPEGYKLLELCDYDSVTMFYTFVIYPEE